ncbi:oligosaccharide flippase family protein [Hansschlegelia quercus]|uniref:Lipopolysaccharide biosynthesis protein n=1 Tax=Hansschlegelia quercus TaxID=2528245 RepID=A0A4Q9GJ13_9HYPH|nr:oligosaccharide flippase family protein [Hansschlegelia quercus]TBN54048.1 lipopolysaccharide biosynthesis protein [Hansschlegelia quercus]
MADVVDGNRKVASAFLWSFAQSWGNRILIFLLFLILARLISPAELGLASTVALILLILSQIAEFGYGQALVQRRELGPHDVDLPFFTAIGLSIVAAAALILFRGKIEAAAELPGLAALLPAAAVSLPIATASAIQEALYKREFDYRTLALRMLVATALSGVVGVGAALAGYGALSLVLQTLALYVVSAVWLWRRPKWTPTFHGDLASWRQLTGFSAHVLGSRMLEFATTRIIDVLVLTLHGIVALGLYTVGARLYQTLMQLLTTALGDVSLSALSRMTDDREGLLSAYLKSITVSATIATPAFVAMSVMSSEITVALFGPKWAAAASVMWPLMLLGAVQTIQFANGAYFVALGRPSYTLYLNVLKLAALAPAMLLIPTRGIEDLTIVFVLGQLTITPLTFWLVVRLLGARWADVGAHAWSALLSLVAAGAVLLIKTQTTVEAEHGVWAALILYGGLYALVYVGLVWLFARRHCRLIGDLLLGAFRSRAPKRLTSV